jgi:hypothetical protein
MATGIDKLPDAEENQEYGGNDKPRKHGPTRDGPGSPALYATQRVLSIPFRLVIETAHTIIGHLIAPEQVTSPGAITLAPRR